MTAPSVLGKLKLNVTDFGPIARAEVDLRPMTVFVGPSNTGKSYMAILIYALHGFFGGRVFGPPVTPRRGYQNVFDLMGPPSGSPWVEDSVRNMVTGIMEATESADRTSFARAIESVCTEPFAINLIRDGLDVITLVGDVLDSELRRVFGIDDASQLVRNKGKSGGRVVVERIPSIADPALESFRYDIVIKGARRGLRASIPDSTSVVFKPLVQDFAHRMARQSPPAKLQGLGDETERMEGYVKFLLEKFAEMTYSQVISPLTSTSYYMKFVITFFIFCDICSLKLR